MRRRSTANRQPVKRRGDHASGQKPGKARTRRASTADLQQQLDQLRRERAEGREQLVATADVLKVISNSNFDLQLVLDTLVESAARLCHADKANIARVNGDRLQFSAFAGFEPAYRKYMTALSPGIDRGSISGRAVLDARIVHIDDVLADAEFTMFDAQKRGGFRTGLGVPLLRESTPIGVFFLTRDTIDPFTQSQIDLVKTFANQAVIAIENTRLFDSEQHRARELADALEQQTATADALKIISRSNFDLQTVLDALTESAARVCRAERANIARVEGENLQFVAFSHVPPEYREFMRKLSPNIDRGSLSGRAVLEGKIVHVADALADPEFTMFEARKRGGFRTGLAVPLLRDGIPIGVFFLMRPTVDPFTDKQIELVATFADQAVIAIENVRLFKETQDALEQQTATSEVLRAISSSPGELEPVFNAMLENATRICGAKFANLFLYNEKDDAFRLAAQQNAPAAYAERWRKNPVLTVGENPRNPLARLAKSKSVVDIPDLMAEPGYLERDPRFVTLVEAAGARTHLLVPMLTEGSLVGAIAIYRQEVGPFTDKQIALLTDFAAQAVIAIENTRLLNELRESLEQQTATSEVLKVISSSQSKLEPVFEAVLTNAVRLCAAKFGTLWLAEGENYLFRCAAVHDLPPAFAEARRREPVVKFAPETGLGRVVKTKQVVHVDDMSRDPAYLARNPRAVALVEVGGARTVIFAPLLKEDNVIGVLTIYRQEVRPFTDKQIELVQNFAAQAVIAIENTRLLNELRESLQQQTATADVLKVISSSPGELEPVFQAMLSNGTRLTEAKFGILWLCEGEKFRCGALHNAPVALAEARRIEPVIAPHPSSPLGRVARTKQVVHVADIKAELTKFDINSRPAFELVDLGGARTILAVPMLKDDELVGVITIYRREVRPFNDKQVALLTSFADQAVIAIENTRLLNELRQRTADLSEALEQQTATSEVLKVISSSPSELEPVFQAMMEIATRICVAKFGHLFLREGNTFRVVAVHGEQRYVDYWRHNPPIDLGNNPEVPLSRLAKSKQVVHIADLRTDQSYIAKTRIVTLVEVAGARTLVVVPMLKEEELIGAIALYRQEVRPFAEKQIDLVKNFAAQAVIAIENARLLNELRESLEQQTATSEVLEVISRSPGELAPVFEAILGNATRICAAKFGTLTQIVDGIPRLMFQLGVPAPLEEYWRRETPRPSSNNAISRVITTGQAVHVTDLQAYQAYIDGDPLAVAGVELGGIRTLLVVPMLKDGKTFGTIGIYRQEVHPFSNKQIELLSNFAAQAAIAIENTRLLNELRQRTDDLSQSLEDLRTAQDRLVQTEKLASLGQLTAGIAHEIKNPLNFVNNFSGVSAELIDELQDVLSGLSIDHKARNEIKELADTLRGNLEKVVQHGKRADAIVKNMLLHSRQGSAEHRPVDINALVEESLNLAYHGARAEQQGFNITLERSLDPTAGEVDVFPQDITRVLLNLISNGFYAATKRKAQADGGYEPTLMAATRNLGDRVEIMIRDNGTGIPPEVRDKMFNPFYTTKPAGEGTGLGLSISHDIIVKQHRGSIEVDTQPGEFTEFRVILPRAALSGRM
jgi:GAF domain-containing protein